LIVEPGFYTLLRFQKVAVRGNYETGNQAFSMDLRFLTIRVAIPFGANTALYFLRDLGRIQVEQELLIIGASGSIGSAGVQLGKHFGATVTAVCSGANVEMVKSLGADQVIDYTKDDFTKNGKTYDLIFDIVGATTFDRCQSSLKPRVSFFKTSWVWRTWFGPCGPPSPGIRK
jgi:hypothetical protein